MRREDARRLGERGSAAVEFALTLPIALLVLAAILRVGLVARDRIVLQEAARAGVREAAVSSDEAAIRSAVNSAGAGLDPAALVVTVERGGGVGASVRVVLTYQEHLGPGWDLLPTVVRLDAAATMRQEFG